MDSNTLEVTLSSIPNFNDSDTGRYLFVSQFPATLHKTILSIPSSAQQTSTTLKVRHTLHTSSSNIPTPSSLIIIQSATTSTDTPCVHTKNLDVPINGENTL
ncbi:hypothetical protein BLNAU_11775 [Blattamonas nauphoetae]|uniref:Uncharacterized protein n=1 Tax=Blattamonas nauphoetae TaxID=2049346 RepID=A0ABQ9XPK6_9EUKA|nr:hypothetical protein BLNAU_11775 [Blattamonas nauphoetae]